MFSPFVKGVGFVVSPTGRKVIRSAVRIARTDEGRKLISQARKVATSPESRKLLDQAVKAASHAGHAAKTPEARQRIKDAARLLRERRG